MPLFIAPGGAVQWFFKEENSIKTNLISLKIPVNVMYSFQVSDAFRIEPYAGIYGRVNIWGEAKSHGESVSLFDEDEWGDAAAKRFQIGWNAGVNFRITEAFTVGAGYFMDIMKFQDYSSGRHDVKSNFQGFDITLGVNF
jgi:opacity protein-like surface antigen